MSDDIPVVPANRSAVYMRISTDGGGQTFDSQKGDLERYCAVNAPRAVWFTDKASGKNFNRPGFERMLGQVRTGHIDRVIVWRLDRLGRTASGLTALFDEFANRHVDLVSLKDGFSLDTPAGKLTANILASMASFERELLGERVRAGLKAAYERGHRPKGGLPGRVCDPTSRSRRQQAVILAQAALAAGQRPSAIKIGEVLGVSRIAVYDFWKKEGFVLPPLERGTAREAEGEGASE